MGCLYFSEEYYDMTLLTRDIQADFDRLAVFSDERWDHNNHYHQFLLQHLPPHCQVRRHLLWRYSLIWKKATQMANGTAQDLGN